MFCLVSSSAWAQGGSGEQKDPGPYCGLYCVYGALQAIGRNVPFEAILRPRYVSSRQGSTINELEHAVVDSGAHAVGLEGLGGETLRTARHAMILHMATDGQLKQYDHWVLYCGMENGNARFLDLPNAMEIVPLSDVLARWNGTALVVSDQPVGVGSIVSREWLCYVNVVVLTVLIVCLADYSLGQFKSARGGETPRPDWTRFSCLLRQSSALLGCSLALGIGLHAIDDAGFFRNPAAARYVAAANISHFFPRLTHGEARRFVVERRGAVIDARLPESFRQGSIPGAINVPVNASPAERREKLGHIPRNTPLLVYCQSSLCEFDEILAALLARDGFQAISLYPGGWKEWKNHDHPDRISR